MSLNSVSNSSSRSRRLPGFLSSEEQAALLSAPNKNVPTGWRNFVMLNLFLNLGLRVSEMIGLQSDDINWKNGRVLIRQGKGNRDRVLWMAAEDLKLIRRWLEMRPEKSPYIFCTLQGKKLNDRYVRSFVKRCSRKRNIGKDVHPHMLRHTFATDLLENTGNIRLVQKALGHSSLLATMIYTHIVDSKLEAAMKNFRN